MRGFESQFCVFFSKLLTQYLTRGRRKTKGKHCRLSVGMLGTGQQKMKKGGK